MKQRQEGSNVLLDAGEHEAITKLQLMNALSQSLMLFSVSPPHDHKPNIFDLSGNKLCRLYEVPEAFDLPVIIGDDTND